MFTFKEFSIRQDRTPMKVGTDGVLLGAWAGVKIEDRHILDIGTGTGLIALMMAQRSNAQITAVEIDEQSSLQADENIKASKWAQRIDVENVNIIDFTKGFRYDLIVSNPPFFSNSLLSPDLRRTSARHTVDLSFEELISSVERLLSPHGRFAVILPCNESEIFEKEATSRLYLSRRCSIKSRHNGAFKRVMSEYQLTQLGNVCFSELAIREANSNEYSEEYRQLTSKFYLKF